MAQPNEMNTAIAKIKKLLALSTSSNPHEAALAAAKAQAMLTQYNLELSQIETRPASRYEQTDVEAGSRVWRRQLLYTLARHHFCEAINDRTKKCMTVIGERHNSELVIYLYGYLVTQLEAMAQHAYAESWTLVAASTWKNAFFYGAVESIHQRLQVQQRQMKATSDQCRSLIVVKDAELQEAVQQLFPQLTKGRATSTRVNNDGYEQGVQAGKNVAFHKAIAQ